MAYSVCARREARRKKTAILMKKHLCMSCGNKKEKERWEKAYCVKCSTRTYKREKDKRDKKRGYALNPNKKPFYMKVTGKKTQCYKCPDRNGIYCGIYGYELKKVRYVCPRRCSNAKPKLL